MVHLIVGVLILGAVVANAWQWKVYPPGRIWNLVAFGLCVVATTISLVAQT